LINTLELQKKLKAQGIGNAPGNNKRWEDENRHLAEGAARVDSCQRVGRLEGISLGISLGVSLHGKMFGVNVSSLPIAELMGSLEADTA